MEGHQNRERYLAISRRQATRIHVQGSKKLGVGRQRHLTAIYNNMEAWYEGQTGQDRQSGHSLMGVSEQRPNGIYPPVDVVQVLPGGVYAVLPLTSPLEVFCT